MEKVHRNILPRVLKPLGWNKVYDKDLKIIASSLLEKQPIKMRCLIFGMWIRSEKGYMKKLTNKDKAWYKFQDQLYLVKDDSLQ